MWLRKRLLKKNKIKIYGLDSFSSGTTLSGKALSIGSTWTVPDAASWPIALGTVSMTTTDVGFHVAYTQLSKSNLTLTLSVKTPALLDWAAGLCFRVQDASNYLMAYIQKESTTKVIKLSKTVGGSESVIDSVSVTMNASETHIITVVTSGNNITVKFDGTTAITDSTGFGNTATRHGLIANSEALVRGICLFDNFKATN